jgi:FkbM family methyltransferase
MQGQRWVVATGSRFIRGTYEPVQSAAFVRLVRPGDVVFDIGAHVGFYSVLSSRLAGPAGRVVAFEPLPGNLRFLRRHLALNACANVMVLEVCVGERSGTARFDDSHGTGVGHLSSGGALDVQVRALDELIAAGELPVPDLIKMDVEGAEVRVLQGAEQVLRASRPTLIVSTHGEELDRTCRDRLAGFGYHVERLEPGVLLATRPGEAPDAARHAAPA